MDSYVSRFRFKEQRWEDSGQIPPLGFKPQDWEFLIEIPATRGFPPVNTMITLSKLRQKNFPPCPPNNPPHPGRHSLRARLVAISPMI
jgi:hypothetical protein